MNLLLILCTVYGVGVTSWVAYNWGYHRGRQVGQAETPQSRTYEIKVDFDLAVRALNGAGYEVRRTTPRPATHRLN